MAKILVVDDDDDLRGEMVNTIAEDDREIQDADSKDKAINLISENDFDVVIVDLELLRGDKTTGMAVLKAAREKDRFTQVIMVTSYGTPKDSVDALEAGAYDYIERGTPGKDFYYVLYDSTNKAIERRKDKLELIKLRGGLS